MIRTTSKDRPAAQCMQRARAVVLAAVFWLVAAPAPAQESVVKAEELIRLQTIPLSRPVAFEAQHPAEQIDFLAWITLRALDLSNSWNPRNRAWNVYRTNVRYSLDQTLRQRWQTAGGMIRSLSQNPDTALPKFYADGMSAQELDDALAFFRSDSGKKYTQYLRQLKGVYYQGQIELDRISIDPDLGKPGDTNTARRKAWLDKKNISLDPPPAGYDFHVRSAQAAFPAAKPLDIVFSLIAGAPPGTEVFQRLDQAVPAADRDAVNRFLSSPASDKEKQARKSWTEAIAKSRDVLPLMLDDVRAILDVVAQWKKVRADPNALPRSIAQIDPASIEIAEEYRLVNMEDGTTRDVVKTCLPGVSDSTVSGMTENINGRSYREFVRLVSLPSAKNVFLARQGVGACIPITIPGYPVPAVNSFVGTIRVIGMDDGDAKRWYRAIAQEIAVNGASESLVVAPNGNAFAVTYAANLRSPHTLIYSSTLLYARTYEPERYRIVQRVANFKSLQTMGTGTKDNVTQFEKSLISTPNDLKRDQDRRARDTSG
jgi:hypothetical protein